MIKLDTYSRRRQCCLVLNALGCRRPLAALVTAAWGPSCLRRNQHHAVVVAAFFLSASLAATSVSESSSPVSSFRTGAAIVGGSHPAAVGRTRSNAFGVFSARKR